MVRKSKGCVTGSAIRPERSEMKPRKAVLRASKDREETLHNRGNNCPEEAIDAEDMQDNELEDKQQIRAFLKARKARLAEGREKKLDDPAATLPEDLPIVKHRSRTKEGYYIYTPDELKMGLPGSGLTDKCPFDCDCCF
ncbi:Hypothetical protein GSB_153402 [Giardia duodenalis]|uniref:DUF1764 domain-containing protein n=2 Tax=Giardia intestinalis TaxID=5741 RepID=C6LXW0_GIAIB|nr:Hypothetical protein GL50581_3629 [Giardia intestinalis ATCC 50581]ESU42735.1 Hypothetical protein GSB_153402 [Giardia intestinalis]